MTPDELFDIEARRLLAWTFLRNENHGTDEQRIRTIRDRARSAVTADHKTHGKGPRGRRPKTLTITAMLGGLAILLTGCVLPPPLPDMAKDNPPPACQEDDPCWDCHTMGNQQCGDEVRIDSPISVVDLEDCVTPDGRPFKYTGFSDNAPWQWCGRTPLLQSQAGGK